MENNSLTRHALLLFHSKEKKLPTLFQYHFSFRGGVVGHGSAILVPSIYFILSFRIYRLTNLNLISITRFTIL